MYATEINCLQGMPLFKDVDLAKLKLVAIAGTREEYAAYDTIAVAGQPSEAVFIVLEGEVEILKETDEVTVPLMRRGSGYVIGDIAVLLGEGYLMTFVAVTPVTVLRLEANVFMELVRDVPQISLAVMRDLGRRVVKLARLYTDNVS